MNLHDSAPLERTRKRPADLFSFQPRSAVGPPKMQRVSDA